MSSYSKIEDYKAQNKKLNAYLMSAKVNQFDIETESKLLTSTKAFRRNLIRHLCVIEAFDDPTQGLVSNWLHLCTTSELVKIAREGRHITFRQKLTALVAVDGYCHTLAAFNWFINESLGKEKKENLSIYTGIVDKTYTHSWLYDESKSILYEPTNIEREIYFGHKVDDPLDFFINESNQIFLLIDEGLIPAKIGDFFMLQFKDFFNDISYTHEELLSVK